MKSKKDGKSNKAVFLDRDGTINIYKKYVYKKRDFKFCRGVFSAVQKLAANDYKIIVVTNQSGVGRGYYAKKDVETLHGWMTSEFERRGVKIDGIYYCPHHPDEKCFCRKPSLGMVRLAKKDFSLDLSKSWMVGDDPKDIYFGKRARMKTILVKNDLLSQERTNPDFRAVDLSEAASIVLGRIKKQKKS